MPDYRGKLQRVHQIEYSLNFKIPGLDVTKLDPTEVLPRNTADFLRSFAAEFHKVTCPTESQTSISGFESGCKVH